MKLVTELMSHPVLTEQDQRLNTSSIRINVLGNNDDSYINVFINGCRNRITVILSTQPIVI